MFRFFGGCCCFLFCHTFVLREVGHKISETLPETNIAPENGWLEYSFPFGMAHFQVLYYFQGGYTRLKYRFRLKWLALLGVIPYTFRCEIKRWTLEAQNGMGTNEIILYKYIYTYVYIYIYIFVFSSCKLKVFWKKLFLRQWTYILPQEPWTLGTYANIYVYVYIYMCNITSSACICFEVTCKLKQLIITHQLANTKNKSILRSLPPSTKKSQILPSKHPNTWGCQNLTIRFLVALD